MPNWSSALPGSHANDRTMSRYDQPYAPGGFQVIPPAIKAIIMINVAVYLIASLAGGGLVSGGQGELMLRGQLWGPAVANGGEWWRIITGGFLHAGMLHLMMNMVFIWILGSQLEPVLGRARFAALYFVCLLCGSLGSLIVAPNTPVVGASGAAFGLLGAAIVMARRRRVDIWSSGLMPALVINLVMTFLVPGIAIGGHIGGVLGGLGAGWALEEIDERSGRASSLVAAVVMGVAVFGLTLVVADQTAAQPAMFGY